MIKIGIIGVGNTGNQLAALAYEELSVPAMAINSSEKDLSTITDNIMKKLIKDKNGSSRGAGKNRKLAQAYLKDSIMTLLTDEEVTSFIKDLKVCFVASSTGGGTGSGAALVLAQILKQGFPKVHIIPIGVLPVENEALSSHVNTLEYLKELYDVLGSQTTYMLYDNDRLSNLSSINMMKKVNQEVISDLGVLRCTYNVPTSFDSIDEEDMMRLITMPGRLIVSRVEDIKDKDANIEELLIKSVKTSAHVELQRDGIISATGIITNLSQDLLDSFDNHIPKVREFIGTPIHDFSHLGINNDRKQPNNVYLIMTGLTMVNDRITATSDRIDEIEEAQARQAEESALDTSKLNELSDNISSMDKQNTVDSSEFDIQNIFDSFGVK